MTIGIQRTHDDALVRYATAAGKLRRAGIPATCKSIAEWANSSLDAVQEFLLRYPEHRHEWRVVDRKTANRRIIRLKLLRMASSLEKTNRRTSVVGIARWTGQDRTALQHRFALDRALLAIIEPYLKRNLRVHGRQLA